MAKIVTLGEIMMRLSTPNHQRIVQANTFDVCYGGGEANVACTLANFGHEAEFVSAVPDNPMGDAAVAELRKYSVGTRHVARCGDRLGIYFLESGSSVRPSKVIYDRSHSSIADVGPDMFDFNGIFKDADWFHFTGITPAISESACAVVTEALKAAKAAGVTVSCDLNYRKKLWSVEKARKVMTKLMEYVDVCIGNEEDADKVLGFTPGDTDVTKGALNLQGYEDIFNQMCDRFGFRYVVSSLRQSYSASDNGWSGCVMDGSTREFYHSRTYRISPIVDRVGGGDAFAGGFIARILEEADMKEALEFAVAGAALKATMPGDFNHISREEAETLQGGDASGRVQR